LLLRSIEAQQEGTEFGEKAVIHFIESSALSLQEMHMPWLHILKEEVKEYQDWFQYCPSKSIHFSLIRNQNP